MSNNAFYAQSGGVTSVINASAAGVIDAVHQHRDVIGKLFAGRHGIIGALTEELIDVSEESPENIAALRYTPAGAFSSCRYKLGSVEEHGAQYQRLIDVFRAHGIRYFFYNGGGDSQDTAWKVSQLSEKMGYPIRCIGIPKTIDNDLPFTDCCPGFGSAAKYAAISSLEASLDVASMCGSSTKVFVMEVMGRNAGWLAAATGLARDERGLGPDIILFPEVPLEPQRLFERTQQAVEQTGYCIVTVAEGVKNQQGQFLSTADNCDAFGHAQLGGVAPVISQMIKRELGYKCRSAVSDYLQRAARHIASRTDVEQAYALGHAAVDLAVAGHNGVMPIVVRTSNQPYRWHLDKVSLASVANVERTLPKDYITPDGLHITERCREYLSPLIEGEDYPPYHMGLPAYTCLQKSAVPKKLTTPFRV